MPAQDGKSLFHRLTLNFLCFIFNQKINRFFQSFTQNVNESISANMKITRSGGNFQNRISRQLVIFDKCKENS